jgi:hypothetical protein
MLKGETESRPAFVSTGPSGSVANEQAAGSASRGRTPLQGHIGFVGLGHMGTAMAANLATAGRQVIAYVRRAEQMGRSRRSAVPRTGSTILTRLMKPPFISRRVLAQGLTI